MLINNIDIKEFDLIYIAVDYDSIPNYNYQPNRLMKVVLNQLKKTTEIPHNLMQVSFGTILECLQVQQPSKVVELISNELNIYAPNKHKVSLWKHYNEQLKECSNLLGTTNAHIKQDSFNQAVWQNLQQENPLNAYMWVIDELSEKWHIPYADVLKQPFADCFVALRIKKVRNEYEDKVLRNRTKAK